MGAGAGCDVEIKNCSAVSVNSIDFQDITIKKLTNDIAITVPCNVAIVGDIEVSSYYHSTGTIADVAMTVTSAYLYLGLGDGYNQDILTPEFVQRFEALYGENTTNELISDVIKLIKLNDIDLSFIERVLSDTYSYIGRGLLGGGWVRSKFDGSFTIDNLQYSDASYTCTIDESFVTEYIDVARYGDNIEYTAFYNGEVLDTYNELDEAINALKREISEDIRAADPSECYVESSYYYLVNGGVDTYEYESDWDYAEVEYTAEHDFGDDLYDVLDELDEENNPDIDEGFEI